MRARWAREDGGKDLTIAVLSERAAGEPGTPDRWHARSRPAAGMVLALARIAAAKAFGRT